MTLSDAIDHQVAEACTGFLQARDPVQKGRHAKAALAALWRGLSAPQRASFLQALDGAENGHAFLEWRQRWPKLADPVMEAAFRAWGKVVQDISGGKFGSEWDRKFAVEMVEKMDGKGKWANWTPSDTQQAHIKRIYRAFRNAQDVPQEPWLGMAAE